MNAVLAAASELQRFCADQSWRFFGGIAVQRWGEPRFTHDADMTLLTGVGNEKAFADALLGHFQPRYVDEPLMAIRRRVLLLQSESGDPLDVAFGAIWTELRPFAELREEPEILSKLHFFLDENLD